MLFSFASLSGAGCASAASTRALTALLLSSRARIFPLTAQPTAETRSLLVLARGHRASRILGQAPAERRGDRARNQVMACVSVLKRSSLGAPKWDIEATRPEESGGLNLRKSRCC